MLKRFSLWSVLVIAAYALFVGLGILGYELTKDLVIGGNPQKPLRSPLTRISIRAYRGRIRHQATCAAEKGDAPAPVPSGSRSA
jgi:hypothetical protein